MEPNTKANLKQIRSTGKEPLNFYRLKIRDVNHIIKESLKTTRSTGKDTTSTIMETTTMDNLETAKNTDRASFTLKMEVATRESSMKINSKEMADINRVMDNYIGGTLGRV